MSFIDDFMEGRITCMRDYGFEPNAAYLGADNWLELEMYLDKIKQSDIRMGFEVIIKLPWTPPERIESGEVTLLGCTCYKVPFQPSHMGFGRCNIERKT